VEARATPGGVLISPAAKIRARDPDSGALLGPGEAGELEISGPSRMLEYYGDAAATRAAFTEDGFLRTGDLGKVEADGGFEFMARMGDVLRLGGFLVSPAEIEAQIQAHPMVESVQVVAAGSASGNRAVAFVTVDKAIAFDEAAIQAHCARQLAKFKVPARVVAVDEFPVTESANGIKIQRAKLREMAEALLN
jgi:fatty-acyl-CoA synthase